MIVGSSERDPKKVIAAMSDMIKAAPSARIGYISIVDAKNLQTVEVISGEVLVALAVFIGKTRLIDNIILKV